MPKNVTEVYQWVVDDVVRKVQELFVQEGIEQSVLNELRDTWLKKLQDSGVMGDPNEEPTSRSSLHSNDHTMRHVPRPRAPAHRLPDNVRFGTQMVQPSHGAGMPQHIRVSGMAGQYPSMARVDGSLRQLPSVAFGVGMPQPNLRTPMMLSQEGGIVPHAYPRWPQPHLGYLAQVQNPQLSVLGNLQSVHPGGAQSVPSATLPPSHGVHAVQGAALSQQQHGPNSYQHTRSSGMHGSALPQRQSMPGAPNNAVSSRAVESVAQRDVVHSGYALAQGNSAKRKAAEGNSQSPTKVLKVEGNTTLLPGRIPQQDGANDEANSDKGGEGVPSANQGGVPTSTTVDDPLGSEEDPPLTDDEEEEEWDSPNFLTAQYEKVGRNKTKWRCSLKFGIFHADGQDYLFRTANGEFEF